MKEESKPVTTSEKIKKSLVNKTQISKLLALNRVKFYEKLKYNDWTPQEIKTLKDNLVIK